MPWQQHVADVAMELTPDGNLHYDRVVVTVPRQSGKTTLIVPVFTHRCMAEFPGNRLDVGPQKQTVAYTAQTRNDARKKWIKEFTPLLERSAFRTSFDKRLTNGSEGFDWSNGSTFDLVATMEKSGHGDTLDLGIIDEAFAQVDDRLEQAMEPAMLTRLSSQLWILSTAGENELKSPFLWAEVESGRRRVESGVESRTAYFEWSCSPDDDLDDIDVVSSRHPAVGHTVTVADLAAKLETAKERGEVAGFRRAYCNVWGAIAGLDVKLPSDAWLASVKPGPFPVRQPGEVVLAFDVDIDGGSASIGVGAETITAPYVELVEHRKDSAWLPVKLVELVERWEPLAVGCNGAGPAGAMVGPVLQAFRDAGIPADLLRQLNATEYKQACGGFYTSVVESQLSRPAQDALTDAGLDAAERVLGDAWAWDRRNANVPISPLVVATLARALLPTEVAVAKVFAY